MKLYYSRAACSLAVRIVIHELGLSCEYAAVDLASKKLEDGSDYFAINPKGSVPVLKTDQGEILTENNVIQQYLADTLQNTRLLPPLGDFKRYRVLEWSNYISTELHKGFSPLFNAEFPQELKEKMVIPGIMKKFQYVDQQLQGKTFLNGDEFTLSDAYLMVILLWCEIKAVDLKSLKDLSAYYLRLKERKSIAQSLEEEGLRKFLSIKA